MSNLTKIPHKKLRKVKKEGEKRLEKKDIGTSLDDDMFIPIDPGVSPSPFDSRKPQEPHPNEEEETPHTSNHPPIVARDIHAMETVRFYITSVL